MIRAQRSRVFQLSFLQISTCLELSLIYIPVCFRACSSCFRVEVVSELHQTHSTSISFNTRQEQVDTSSNYLQVLQHIQCISIVYASCDPLKSIDNTLSLDRRPKQHIVWVDRPKLRAMTGYFKTNQYPVHVHILKPQNDN